MSATGRVHFFFASAWTAIPGAADRNASTPAAVTFVIPAFRLLSDLCPASCPSPALVTAVAPSPSSVNDPNAARCASPASVDAVGRGVPEEPRLATMGLIELRGRDAPQHTQRPDTFGALVDPLLQPGGE